MRTPTLFNRPGMAVVAVIAAAAILLTVLHQGNATANTGPPDAPANPLAHLIVSDGDEPRVRVSWDAPATAASGYVITRNDGNAFQVANATTYSDHTVQPGERYSYTVSARNDQGSSPASASASADVPDAPSAPANLAAAVAEPQPNDTTGTITLTWDASTVPAAGACDTTYPLTGYTVVRSHEGGEAELGSPDAGATSFTDDTAAFGVNYTYRVAARNAIGSSPVSETSAQAFAPAPLAPTGLSASIADPFDGNVSLSWNAPTEGPAVVGYMALRYLGADPYQGADIPTTLAEMATDTTLVDDAAGAGITYSYIVISRSADNISEPSNTAAIEAPAPASALTATIGDGAINLAWSPPTAGTPVNYRVERQEDGAWAQLADTNDTSHPDATAQANVEYRYRVQHRNQYGGSTWAESDAVTLVTAPGKPTGLTAVGDGDDNVLSWTAPDSYSIDGYRVQHHADDAEPQTLAEGITDTGYRHADAPADVTHHYAVQAYNSAGDGPWSDTASTIRITPPGVPQNVAAQLDGNDIVVTWERPDTVHINGYTVRYQAGDETPVDSQRLSTGQTSFRMTEVTGDVTYRTMVRAHNDVGDGDWSSEATVRRVLAPSVPTDVAVKAGDEDIVLSWSPPKVGQPDGYHVQYGTADQDVEDLQQENLQATAGSFTHSDNLEGTAYQYRVRAHNSAGEGPWSDTLQATRLLKPGAPTGLSAQAQASSIIVAWGPPATGTVTSYELEYGVSGATETTTVELTADQREFTHIGAPGDTEHSYRVRARNDVGNGLWAGPATAMWVIPPTPPTNVSAAIDGDDILVSWSAPDSTFIDGYNLQYRAQNTEEWTRVDLTAAQLSHRHTAPTAGTTYSYQIRAHNAGGNSDWSDVTTAVWYQGAAPPSQIMFLNFGDRLMVRWLRSVSEGVTGYQLRQNIDDGQWTQHDVSTHFFADWSDDQSHHDYQVRALIGDQPGNWSAIQRATIATPTAVPSISLNREGAASIRLHWEEPESGAPYVYAIEGKWKDSDTYNRISTTAGLTRTTRIDMGYDSGYTIRVAAQNDVGIKGPYQDGVTVQITIPAAEHQSDNVPRGLNAFVQDGSSVRLTWYEPERTGHQVDSYRIYRKQVSDTRRLGDSYEDHVLIPQTGSTATSYIDNTAQPGVAYEYGVAAYRSRYQDPLSPVSHRAYARTWE